jgi:hypothetical protein
MDSLQVILANLRRKIWAQILIQARSFSLLIGNYYLQAASLDIKFSLRDFQQVLENAFLHNRCH